MHAAGKNRVAILSICFCAILYQWSFTADAHETTLAPTSDFTAGRGSTAASVKHAADDTRFLQHLLEILESEESISNSDKQIAQLVSSEFEGAIVMIGGHSGQYHFGNPVAQEISFTIVIPLFQRAFEIRYRPPEGKASLIIESDGQWYALKEFVPQLRALVTGPVFKARKAQARDDLALRLRSAVAAEDESQVLDTMQQMARKPSKDHLTALAETLGPARYPNSETYRWPVSETVYSVLGYMYFEILSSLDPNETSRIATQFRPILSNVSINAGRKSGRSGPAAQYAFENGLRISEKDPNRASLLRQLIFTSSKDTEETHSFSGQALAETIGISAVDVENILEKLYKEGHVGRNKDGSYSTTLSNVLSATALYQTYLDRLLSTPVPSTTTEEGLRAFQQTLGDLMSVQDVRTVDFAYRTFLAHRSDPEASRYLNHGCTNVIRHVCFNLANPLALGPVIARYYPKIKAIVMEGVPRSGFKYDNYGDLALLIASVGRARVMDDELSGHLMAALEGSDRDLGIARTLEKALKEGGKLIEGPSALDRSIVALLEMQDVDQIFSSEIRESIKNMPALLEKLSRSDLNDPSELEGITTLTMALFNRYLSFNRAEIRGVLELLLGRLTEQAEKLYKLYGKMGGAFYQAITWERFQKFYGFLKRIRKEMVTAAQEKRQLTGLLGSIEGLMEQQGDLATETDLVPAETFAEKYQQTLDTDSLLALLFQQYPMEGVKIDVKNRPSFFAGVSHGLTEKIGPKKYKITLVNARERTLQYLLFHEFMHVWLVENGLTVDWVDIGSDNARYLFQLKNMVDDYIIEKENHRHFGSGYADLTEQLRDTDLRGQMMGQGIDTSNVEMILLGLTANVTTSFYHELRNSLSARFVGTVVQWEGIGDLMAVLSPLTVESKPSSYRAAVAATHALLTDDEPTFIGTRVSVDTKKIQAFTRDIDTQMTPIKAMLKDRIFGQTALPGPPPSPSRGNPELPRAIQYSL